MENFLEILKNRSEKLRFEILLNTDHSAEVYSETNQRSKAYFRCYGEKGRAEIISARLDLAWYASILDKEAG